MTQSNQQSAHAAADHPYSGQTLLGVSRRTARSKVLARAEAQAYRPNARNEFSAWPTTSVGMAYNPPASRSPAGASAFAVVT
jgi:hypothetical protein